MLRRFLMVLSTSLAFAAGAQTVVQQPASSPSAADTKPGVQEPSTALEAQVMTRFKERFGNMPINKVRQTPYGLFEVQLGNSLIYVDEDVQFVLDGHLIDAKTRRNLTQERLDDLAKVDFDALPLDLAIKQVRGDGSRRIAIFEDPNCGYCKQLRQNMEGIDNLTVYTFLYPILSADSTDKVRHVWCAKDPGATWDDWMLRNKEPAPVKCDDAPIGEMLELGRSLLVQGTPAIFFEDGSRVPGVISMQELNERLK